jgi:hypothetical protein
MWCIMYNASEVGLTDLNMEVEPDIEKSIHEHMSAA